MKVDRDQRMRKETRNKKACEHPTIPDNAQILRDGNFGWRAAAAGLKPLAAVRPVRTPPPVVE